MFKLYTSQDIGVCLELFNYLATLTSISSIIKSNNKNKF